MNPDSTTDALYTLGVPTFDPAQAYLLPFGVVYCFVDAKVATTKNYEHLRFTGAVSIDGGLKLAVGCRNTSQLLGGAGR